MSTSLKFKEKTELDTRSYKCLLLALVKLIHADPKLMLHVSTHVTTTQQDFVELTLFKSLKDLLLPFAVMCVIY